MAMVMARKMKMIQSHCIIVLFVKLDNAYKCYGPCFTVVQGWKFSSIFVFLTSSLRLVIKKRLDFTL